MSVATRLGRLERARRAARGLGCAHCADWPPTRIHDATEHDPPATSGAPADECPRCGWRPLIVRIEYEPPAVRR